MVRILFGPGSPKNQPSIWFILLGLWVIALIVRIIFYKIFLSYNPCLLMFDSGHYHTMAVHLLEQGSFCDAQGIYDFYRMPGYPLFLAVCYKIFGIWPQAAIAVQMVIAAFMPVQVFFLVQAVGKICNLSKIFLQRLSFIVSTIAIFHMGALIFSGLVMTDMLFAMMFLLFLQLLTRAFQESKWKLMLLAGLTLGLCNLVRPLIFLPFGIVGLVFLLASGAWWLRAKLSFSLLSGWAIPVLGWALRNWLLTGVWFLHTLSGPHLLNHGAARVYGMAHHTTHEAARAVVCTPTAVNQLPVISSQNQERVARTILLRYWPQTLHLCIINCVKTVAGLYSSELLVIDAGGELPSYDGSCNLWKRAQRFLYPQVRNNVVRYVCWYEIGMNLFLMIGLLGFIVCCWRFIVAQQLMMLLLGICLCMIATTAICGFARLRLPIEPILIMVSILFYLCGARTKDSRL